MDFSGDTKPMILNGQYLANGNSESIKLSFFDLMKNQLLTCSVKTYPRLIGRADDFDLLSLSDLFLGECFAVEIIGLNGFQALVRFYLPGQIELSELEDYQQILRNALTHRIDLWFFENLGWTRKTAEILAGELYERRLARLRNFQREAVNRLGLIPYPLSDFQILPDHQIGISQFQLAGPQQKAWISQMKPESLHPQPGISQIPHENLEPEIGVDRDIPRGHPVEESDISLTREDQELPRLWIDGFTAKENGIRTGETGKTVSNRLSILRGMYGGNRIPHRKTPNRKVLG